MDNPLFNNEIGIIYNGKKLLPIVSFFIPEIIEIKRKGERLIINSNVEIIKKIIMEKSTNITFDKEELTEQMKEISLKFFNESCCVYFDKIDDSKYTLEVHFNDCNYYEIDISDTDTIEIISENILRDFVNERFIDKESIGENRNNIRYIRKYC